MKAFIFSFALALFFTVGTTSADSGASHDGNSKSGCSYSDKWKDT